MEKCCVDSSAEVLLTDGITLFKSKSIFTERPPLTDSVQLNCRFSASTSSEVMYIPLLEAILVLVPFNSRKNSVCPPSRDSSLILSMLAWQICVSEFSTT